MSRENMKQKTYKLAIFDLDGTILNTIEDLCNSTNYALKAYNMPTRSLTEVKSFVGNGIMRLIEQAVVEGSSREEIDQVFHCFNTHYKEHCADLTKPYEGIREVISHLRSRGILTAVVSNKADYGVQSLCQEYFPGLFDFAVGEKEGIRRKPAPDSVNAVLERFGIDRDEAVYIGDSEVDYQTSVNAGMDVIMVGWGFREEDYIRSIGAEFVIHEPKEIEEFFS